MKTPTDTSKHNQPVTKPAGQAASPHNRPATKPDAPVAVAPVVDPTAKPDQQRQTQAEDRWLPPGDPRRAENQHQGPGQQRRSDYPAMQPPAVADEVDQDPTAKPDQQAQTQALDRTYPKGSPSRPENKSHIRDPLEVARETFDRAVPQIPVEPAPKAEKSTPEPRDPMDYPRGARPGIDMASPEFKTVFSIAYQKWFAQLTHELWDARPLEPERGWEALLAEVVKHWEARPK